MATAVAKRLINVEEYYKMAEVGILKPEDRVELIGGEIFEMSPIGSRHAGIVNKLAKILNNLLAEEAIVSVQAPIRLGSNNEPQPDIAILRYDAEFYTSAHPQSSDVHLIIEVADSSLEYDREIKLPLYASSLIPEYWIVNLESSQVEVYRRPHGQNYTEKKVFDSHESIPLRTKKLLVSEIIIS